METEKYLEQILGKEGLTKDSAEAKAMQVEKAKVEKAISDVFDGSPVIRYAGSYKKETMIRASYDLDIVCYFKHDDDSAGNNLEDIFNNVKDALAKQYTIIPKKSALRLQGENKFDFHIDVVPGRFVDDSEGDTFLYQLSGDKKRLKTNLDVHIGHIKDSGLTKTIKLVKIWKNIYSIDVKTFVLELLVVKVLDKSKDDSGLEKCLKKFFEELSTNIDNVSIEDPANSGNDLSLLFDSAVKSSLSAASANAIGLINENKWEDLFGTVEDVDKSYVINSLKTSNTNQSNSPKPWLNQ
jgi:hypothetical protein